jgi:hypothetical protein
VQLHDGEYQCNNTVFSFSMRVHVQKTYIRGESTHLHGLVDTKLKNMVAYKLDNACS